LTPDAYIATLTDKKAELELILTVEEGVGYVPAEARQKEKLPVGTISLDATFTPIKKVNFEVENMRVGERTDYNRLRIFIETDGSILPRMALKQAANILEEHYRIISDVPLLEEKEEKEEVIKKAKEKETKKKTAKAKKLKNNYETFKQRQKIW